MMRNINYILYISFCLVTYIYFKSNDAHKSEIIRCIVFVVCVVSPLVVKFRLAVQKGLGVNNIEKIP